MKPLFTLLRKFSIGEWSLLIAAVLSPVGAYYSLRVDLSVVQVVQAQQKELIARQKEDQDKHAAEDRARHTEVLDAMNRLVGRIDNVIDRWDRKR